MTRLLLDTHLVLWWLKSDPRGGVREQRYRNRANIPSRPVCLSEELVIGPVNHR
jgi:PIN domain nuclease of toxin-antitoxin system